MDKQKDRELIIAAIKEQLSSYTVSSMSLESLLSHAMELEIVVPKLSKMPFIKGDILKLNDDLEKYKDCPLREDKYYKEGRITCTLGYNQHWDTEEIPPVKYCFLKNIRWVVELEGSRQQYSAHLFTLLEK